MKSRLTFLSKLGISEDIAKVNYPKVLYPSEFMKILDKNIFNNPLLFQYIDYPDTLYLIEKDGRVVDISMKYKSNYFYAIRPSNRSLVYDLLFIYYKKILEKMKLWNQSF